jgi:hypothetical protein
MALVLQRLLRHPPLPALSSNDREVVAPMVWIVAWESTTIASLPVNPAAVASRPLVLVYCST